MPYIIVRGNLASYDNRYPWRVLVSGLKAEDIEQLKRFASGGYCDDYTIVYLQHPTVILTALEVLGYQVVASSSTAVKQDYNEYMWTMRKDFAEPDPLTRKNIPLLGSFGTDMTEQFYIAVKGSLHSSDSSVFGLTSEEFNALSKRYPDSNKEVINGVLIKASPLRVINSLGELGYRVVCSSGETEIVWTLKRDVLGESPRCVILRDSTQQRKLVGTAKTQPKANPSSLNSQIDRGMKMDHSCEQSCSNKPSHSSLHQTLDEMDFERGIWPPAMSGDVESVKVHLRKGTNPDSEDRGGYTALHYAARGGHPQVCSLLIESGASVNKATRAGAATALHRAALAGHHETCVILIRHGADLLARDIDYRTPLHRAVEGGHKKVIDVLVDKNPALPFEKDKRGKSSVDYAEERGFLLLFPNKN